MESGEQLARVRALPDGELVSSLNGLLRASRRTVAEVIAHLGEVEERRLYLLAGHGSMFSYCVARLGMSEDEACRRIDVARLARRHPLLFERLADGGVSLSVAALLKTHLTGENAAALLDAVSGKTVWQAKEVLAAWFPQPDVLPSVRKLPARKENAVLPGCTPVEAPAAQLGLSGVGGQVTHPPAVPTLPCPHKVGAPSGSLPSAGASSAGASSGAAASGAAEPARPTPADGSRSPAPTAIPAHRHATHRSIEPLSAARYKVQLTASAELKHKLELARDLLRHAIPSGDLAALIERALDVLLEQTMKRRFAMPARARSSASSAPRARATANEPLAASVEARASKTQSSPITQIASAGPIAMSVGSTLPAEPLTSTDPLSMGRSPINGTEPTTRTEPTRTEPTTGSLAASTISATTSVEPSVSAKPLSTSAEAVTTMTSPSASAEPTAGPLLTATSAGGLASAGPDTTNVAAATPRSSPCSRHLPSDVRRRVFVRDEARCTWTSPDGVRCNSRAWLEHDHVIPRGMGGGNDPSNIRLRCRAHNQLAAEQAYGRDTISRIVARRRRSRPPRHDGSEDSTSP